MFAKRHIFTVTLYYNNIICGRVFSLTPIVPDVTVSLLLFAPIMFTTNGRSLRMSAGRVLHTSHCTVHDLTHARANTNVQKLTGRTVSFNLHLQCRQIPATPCSHLPNKSLQLFLPTHISFPISTIFHFPPFVGVRSSFITGS